MSGNYPRTPKKKIKKPFDVDRMMREEERLKSISHSIITIGEYSCSSYASAQNLAARLNILEIKVSSMRQKTFNSSTLETETTYLEYVAANHFNPRVICTAIKPLEDTVNDFEIRRIDEHSDSISNSISLQQERAVEDISFQKDNVGYDDTLEVERGLRSNIIDTGQVFNPAYLGVAIAVRNHPESIYPNFNRFATHLRNTSDDADEDYVRDKFVDYAPKHTNVETLQSRDKIRFEPSYDVKDDFDTQFAIDAVNPFTPKVTELVSKSMQLLPVNERKIFYTDDRETGDALAHFNPLSGIWIKQDETEEFVKKRGIYLNRKITSDFITSGKFHHEVVHGAIYFDDPQGYEEVDHRVGLNKNLVPVGKYFHEASANRTTYDKFENRSEFKSAVIKDLNIISNPADIMKVQPTVFQDLARKKDPLFKLNHYTQFAEKVSFLETADSELHSAYMDSLEASKDVLKDDYEFVRGLVDHFSTARRAGFIDNINKVLDYVEDYYD